METNKTEILIETHERIVVNKLPDAIYAGCAACRTQTIFIKPEHAAVEFNLTIRQIFRLVERGEIHCLETSVGSTLLCRASLSHRSSAAESEPHTQFLTEVQEKNI